MQREWSEMLRFSLRWTAAQLSDPVMLDGHERAQRYHHRLMSTGAAFCVTRFVQVETLPEPNHGLEGGWGTALAPPLGIWQQRQLRRLSADGLENLRHLIGGCLLTGYAAQVLMEGAVRKEIYRAADMNHDVLFAWWASLLHGRADRHAFAVLEPLLVRVMPRNREVFRRGLDELGLRVNILYWPRLAAVVRGYIESGVLLRMVETAPHYRRQIGLPASTPLEI